MGDPAKPRVDFFGIGAPKCGTTWMAHCLDEHPEITLSNEKEPNFFVRKMDAVEDTPNPAYLRDWAEYRRQWPDDDTLHGEFSTNLIHNVDSAPALIQQHYPGAKLLVMLRDPVRRTYSHYYHIRREPFRTEEQIPSTFEQALETTRIVERSKYAWQLEPWFERFGRDQIKILLDLDITADPAAAVAESFEFLGVDPEVRPPSLAKRYNVNFRRRGLTRRAVGAARRLRRARLGRVVDLAKRLGVERVVRRFDRGPAGYPPMRRRTQKRLRSEFRSDVGRVEALIGRDLGPWKGSSSA